MQGSPAHLGRRRGAPPTCGCRPEAGALRTATHSAATAERTGRPCALDSSRRAGPSERRIGSGDGRLVEGGCGGMLCHLLPPDTSYSTGVSQSHLFALTLAISASVFLNLSLAVFLSIFLFLSFCSVFLGLYACPLASFYLSLCVSHDFWLSLLCISVSLPHPRHYLSNFVLWWKPASPISVEIRGPGPSGASRQRLLTCPDSVYKSELSWGHFSYPILPVLQACPLPVWPGMMYTAPWHLILIHKSWVDIYLRNPSWWHQTRIMVFKESWGVFAPSSASGHLRLYCGHLDGSEPRNNVCSAQEVPATIGWIPLGRAGKLPHPPT